jgi:hypothetical protein
VREEGEQEEEREQKWNLQKCIQDNRNMAD